MFKYTLSTKKSEHFRQEGLYQKFLVSLYNLKSGLFMDIEDN